MPVFVGCCLPLGDKSVQALEKDVCDWIAGCNTYPNPFVWTKTAEEILDSLARYCQRISGVGH
jgi:hypothetical protein